jgi:hypothetical protein
MSGGDGMDSSAQVTTARRAAGSSGSSQARGRGGAG